MKNKEIKIIFETYFFELIKKYYNRFNINKQTNSKKII